MGIAKDILAGVLNLAILMYVIVGIVILGILTVFHMAFCWSDSLKTVIADMYKTTSDSLKELL